MARVGIIFGLLLCGLTYAALVATNIKSPIQFVPMMIGIPTLFCGVVALNPHRRKQSMQASACLALVGTVFGILDSLGWLMHWISNDEIYPYAVAVNIALTLVSGIFLMICIAWFIQDRRRRHLQRSPVVLLPTVTAPEDQPSRESA